MERSRMRFADDLNLIGNAKETVVVHDAADTSGRRINQSDIGKSRRTRV